MFGEDHKGGKESEDDEDFFKPTPNSTLASIFGMKPKSGSKKSQPPSLPSSAPKSVKVSDRYGPSNFRYVPPSNEEPLEEDKKPEWAVVQAKVVSAYELLEGTNVFRGKVALALLQSDQAYRLLLYRTKADVLGAVTLTHQTKLLLKQDYLQFRTEDEHSFWSVLFENDRERDQFLARIESQCVLEREPIVEEPLSEAERVPKPATKSSLISRMARMGQAIPLPLADANRSPAAPVSDSSDTSDSKIETIPRPSRRSASPGVGKLHPMPFHGMQMMPTVGTMAMTGNVQTAGTPADVTFSLAMSENRMQNTEVRMNLTKLETKIDRVLDKIDLLGLGGGSHTKQTNDRDKDEDILLLEEKLLEQKRENHGLRAKVRTLEAETGQKKEVFLLEEKLKEAEEKIRNTTALMQQLQSKLDDMRRERDNCAQEMERVAKELTSKSEESEAKTKDIKMFLQRLKECEGQIKTLTVDNDKLEQQLHESRGRVSQLEVKVSAAEQIPSTAVLVKDIMNGCYQQLCEQINDPAVLRVIAQTIKRETKSALDREEKKS